MSKKNRFFGLHFDFHAQNNVEIGSKTSPSGIEKYIIEMRPDFIQCDCKGHPGNSSYPTKVGKSADKLVADNFKIWCDTIKKHNIPVYVHYSGVWDFEYVKAHPEAAAINEKGESGKAISLFSDYADKLLIPQIKELISDYHIDGAWIDGDCWAVERDYSDNAKPYLHEGITKEEHNKIMREAFFRYADNYVNKIHDFAPDFKIASAWAFSSQIPEKPIVDFDFLSGDNYTLHIARFESRCMAAQGKPWDLMAWSFTRTDQSGRNLCDKPAVQIMQEAANTLSCGGGFQLYIIANPDGSVRKSYGTRFHDIANFVHERKINFEKKPVFQVAVFFSAETYYKNSDVFVANGAKNSIIGTVNCILDAQYTSGIVYEYQIDTINQYNIVVVPEWEFISDDIKNKLLQYADNGGKLIIIGATLCAQFGKLLNKSFGNETALTRKFICDSEGCFGMIESKFINLNNSSDERIYDSSNIQSSSVPSHYIYEHGNGKIAFIPFDLGTSYIKSSIYLLSTYIKNILSKLEPPLIEINKKYIDASIQKADEGILINLINLNQGKHDVNIYEAQGEYYIKPEVYDEIPPIYDIEIKFNKSYNEVLMPLGEKFEYEISENCIKIRLTRLDIHSVIILK